MDFFSGIILYTFLHFDSTPAIITSVVIGLAIVFCAGAVVHNVFLWRKVRLTLFIQHLPPFKQQHKLQKRHTIVEKLTQLAHQ